MENQDIDKAIVVYGKNFKSTGRKYLEIESILVKEKIAEIEVDKYNTFQNVYGSLGYHKKLILSDSRRELLGILLKRYGHIILLLL